MYSHSPEPCLKKDPFKEEEPRKQLLASIRRWGGSSSTALLESDCNFFSLVGTEGFIGYRSLKGCAVVLGNPICHPDDIPRLATAFHESCQKRGERVLYIVCSDPFAKWASDNICDAILEFGTELLINPTIATEGRLVHRKTRHALKEEVEVQEYLSENLPLKAAMEAVGTAWLKNRQGPQIFLSHCQLFSDPVGKRWFYAKQGEKVVGVLVLNELQAHGGWLLNRVMATPDAAHGTPELLVKTALDHLHREGCSYVNLGPVPGERLGEITGFNLFFSWLARSLFQVARKTFHLDGKRVFWQKFEPISKPCYLLFSHSSIGWREIRGLMQALHIGSPRSGE
jgi:lysylphosphatidylglycerol synthetase-like protein (DUF2156 family)